MKSYQEFAHRIDIDALEEAMGWEPIERTGDEDRGYCLDIYGLHKHGDTTGKFSINREKRVYHCWVCGGGSLLSLAMEFNSMSQDEATQWLYQFTSPQTISLAKEIDQILETESPRKEFFPQFNQKILTPWVQNKHSWFNLKNIADKTREEFQLGFDPQALRFHRAGKETPYEGPAIILPHFWQRKLVGWQSRWLDEGRPKWIPKYTNTSGFPKQETLWAYDRALQESEPPIIVESVPTAAFLWSLGISSIATFGATVTKSQMRLLRKFQAGIIIAADNDQAGIEGRKELTNYLSRFIPIMWAPLAKDESADLADCEIEEVRELLSDAYFIY